MLEARTALLASTVGRAVSCSLSRAASPSTPLETPVLLATRDSSSDGLTSSSWGSRYAQPPKLPVATSFGLCACLPMPSNASSSADRAPSLR